MSVSTCHAARRFLNASALLVLALGLLARPLAVFACDVNDARGTVAAQQGIAADLATQDPGGDCCANAACGECCAPVPLVTPAVTHLPVFVPMRPRALSEPPGRLEPAVYPVSSRPPIHV
jgi:hypothetical protein